MKNYKHTMAISLLFLSANLSAKESQRAVQLPSTVCNITRVEELLQKYDGPQRSIVGTPAKGKTTEEDESCVTNYLQNKYRANYKYPTDAAWLNYSKDIAKDTYDFSNLWIMDRFENAPSLSVAKMEQILSSFPRGNIFFKNVNGLSNNMLRQFPTLVIKRMNHFNDKASLFLESYGPTNWVDGSWTEYLDSMDKSFGELNLSKVLYPRFGCVYDYSKGEIVDVVQNTFSRFLNEPLETTQRQSELVAYRLRRIECDADQKTLDPEQYMPNRIIIRKNQGVLYFRTEVYSPELRSYIIQQHAYIDLEVDRVRSEESTKKKAVTK